MTDHNVALVRAAILSVIDEGKWQFFSEDTHANAQRVDFADAVVSYMTRMACVSAVTVTDPVVQLLRDIQSNMASGEPEWSSIEARIEGVLRDALRLSPQTKPSPKGYAEIPLDKQPAHLRDLLAADRASDTYKQERAALDAGSSNDEEPTEEMVEAGAKVIVETRHALRKIIFGPRSLDWKSWAGAARSILKAGLSYRRSATATSKLQCDGNWQDCALGPCRTAKQCGCNK